MLYVVASLISLVALASCEGTGSTGIGEGFYLPGLSIVEDNGYGSRIFQDIPKECIKFVASYVNRQEKTNFENTQSFYSKMGTDSSLSGEVTANGFTLGATLNAASQSIASSTLNVKGISLDVYAITGYSQLIPDCLYSNSKLLLDKEFSDTFKDLPANVPNPHRSTSWYKYDNFLKTFGSHVTKRISQGSKLTRYVFSKSSEQITSDQFSIKVCATVKELSLKACSGYTQEDYSKVTHLETSDTITVRGGSAETRGRLIGEVTKEWLEKLLAEAELTEQPVSVQYDSIWHVLRTRFLGTEHLKKAVNLEAYYLGFLNTGCYFQQANSNKIDMRKFVLAHDDRSVPSYECQLAPKGCRSDDDCHLRGAGSTCYCFGDGCVIDNSVSDPKYSLKDGRKIRTSEAGSAWDGENNSCYYKFIAHCDCDTDWDSSWQTVWPKHQYGYSKTLDILGVAQTGIVNSLEMLTFNAAPCPAVDGNSTSTETSETCTWITKDGTKLKNKIAGEMPMEAAKTKCEETKNCKGVTCKNEKKCWMNAKAKGKDDKRFTAYIINCSPIMD